MDLTELAAEVEDKAGDGQALAPPPARRLGELVLPPEMTLTNC